MGVHYYPLVNKIMTKLHLFDSSEEIASLSSTPFPRPFITVAREPGSGGAPIAQQVAKQLSFQFVDEEIVKSIAESTQKREEIIAQVDEKSRDLIGDMVHSLLNKDYVNDIEYLKELVKIILAFATKGHVVILGRGSNFITPFARGLHVNVTAPYEVRVQRAMEYEGHSKRKAKSVIAKVEKEREKFVKQYLGHDLSKRNAYDLTLNTSAYSVNEAAHVVCEAFYHKFPAKTRYKAVFDRMKDKI
jgi:cytidylate kinase